METQKMIRQGLSIIVLILVLCSTALAAATSDTVPPRVVDTSPENHARSVDPSLKEISVTFDEPMMDKSWSWSYEDKNTFPQMTGQPYYTDGGTRCVLPVKLEPKKEYVIWINMVKFRNFRDKAGNPAEPYKLTFRTR